MFYYMHNLHGTDAERALTASFVALWRDCNFGDDQEAVIKARLQAFTALPSFDDFISRLASKVEARSY